jgi:hypothetical protein
MSTGIASSLALPPLGQVITDLKKIPFALLGQPHPLRGFEQAYVLPTANFSR